MKNHPTYALTEKQVEDLASQHMVAEAGTASVRSTYLRVILTACQSALGKPKRALQVEEHLYVLETVHAKYYAAVLRGILTPDVAPDDRIPAEEQSARARERNRRSTFARSAKSTVATFIRGGGDLRGLDVPEVTKASLRVQSPSMPNVRLHRAQADIVRIVLARAQSTPDEARLLLEGVMSELQEVLEDLPGASPKIVGDELKATPGTFMVRRGRRPVQQNPQMMNA